MSKRRASSDNDGEDDCNDAAGSHAHESSRKRAALSVVGSLKVLSWNVDGLACETPSRFPERLRSACRIMAPPDEADANLPDVIFLQEMTREGLPIVAQLLEERGYFRIPRQDDWPPYFVMMFTKRSTVGLPQEFDEEHFASSQQGRLLLGGSFTWRGIHLNLYTSHLESLKAAASQRKAQLKRVFERLTDNTKTGSKAIAVFAGDANARDAEITQIGGLPTRTVDVWTAAGASKDQQFTWDLARNPNARTTFVARCRFDRAYLASSADQRVTVRDFELIGLRPTVGPLHPSDHFGLRFVVDTHSL